MLAPLLRSLMLLRNLFSILWTGLGGKHSIFDIWLDDATRILRQLSLHRFLDQNIERPDPEKNSSLAARWVKTSKKIQAWLYQSIPKEVNRLVQTTRCRHDFAGGYVALLKKVLDFAGHNAAGRDMVAFWNLRRSKFSSAIAFVSAFRKAYAQGSKEGGREISDIRSLWRIWRPGRKREKTTKQDAYKGREETS